MKIRCAIVDDEELARKLLEQYVLKIPQLELTGTYKSPLLLMEDLNRGNVDLLFLDIQMPDITGTDFLRSLNQKPAVIFTTAYPEHALEGYELDVLDYLLKPISFERFFRSVQKAVSFLKPAPKPEKQEDPAPPPVKDFLAVNADHKIYKIRFDEILYIEGLREYVSYYTTEGQRIIALESLKKLEELLPASKFMRIHKSYIIPLDKVKVVEGNMVHIADKKLPIGASYREEVLKKLFEK